MSSNFDEFYVTLQQNSFFTIALSETWLRDNEHLLKHLRTPGDNFVCNSRQQTRGGGVGAYIQGKFSFAVREYLN